jgi:type I restriction enzyme S subunit
VEYRKLGDCARILDSQRKPVTKGKRTNGVYPYYGANGIQDYVADYIFDGDYLLIGEDGSVINPDKSPVLNWASGKFWVNNHAHILAENLDIALLRYLFYALQKSDVSDIVRGTPPKLNQVNLRNIEIPIPPLAVQEEIVKILDRFAEYTAELQAELQARKEQYEYYRNLLLTFNPSASGYGTDDEQKIKDITVWGGYSYEVSWKTLGEICTFKYGYTEKAQDFGTARYIRITDINDDGCLVLNDKKYVDLSEDSQSYLVKKGDLLMARTGATFGKTLYVDTDEVAVYASFLIRITFNTSTVLNRFYWHYSKSKYYWQQANKLVSTGGQPQFNANALAQVVIPIPPLEVQERIVAILDRFETLVNDLTQGLPAEIEARKQQYEYYRNHLLTFKRIA